MAKVRFGKKDGVVYAKVEGEGLTTCYLKLGKNNGKFEIIALNPQAALSISHIRFGAEQEITADEADIEKLKDTKSTGFSADFSKQLESHFEQYNKTIILTRDQLEKSKNEYFENMKNENFKAPLSENKDDPSIFNDAARGGFSLNGKSIEDTVDKNGNRIDGLYQVKYKKSLSEETDEEKKRGNLKDLFKEELNITDEKFSALQKAYSQSVNNVMSTPFGELHALIDGLTPVKHIDAEEKKDFYLDDNDEIGYSATLKFEPLHVFPRKGDDFKIPFDVTINADWKFNQEEKFEFVREVITGEDRELAEACAVGEFRDCKNITQWLQDNDSLFQVRRPKSYDAVKKLDLDIKAEAFRQAQNGTSDTANGTTSKPPAANNKIAEVLDKIYTLLKGSTNSTGIEKMQSVLAEWNKNTDKRYPERVFVKLQDIARQRTSGIIGNIYARSSFFGNGRSKWVDGLYKTLGDFDITKSNISNLTTEISKISNNKITEANKASQQNPRYGAGARHIPARFR